MVVEEASRDRIAARIVFWLVSLPGLTTPHPKVPTCCKILHRTLDLDYLE